MNLDLWNRVVKTDPRHVKPITGKQYSGNSPKPYYIVHRLTEEFGPCGKGWGFTVINERFERFSDTDSLHVALLEFWYVLEGATHHFQQMGQTKASYMSSGGKFILDEDAPKKSVTDALVKCASYLGFAGDIFSGRWDDSKYVAELKKEFAETDPLLSPRADPPNDAPGQLERQLLASIEREQKRAGVMAAVLKDIHLAPETLISLRKFAGELGGLKPGNAFDAVKAAGLDSDETTYLWSLLDSKTRSALKREKDTRAMAQATKETANE